MSWSLFMAASATCGMLFYLNSSKSTNNGSNSNTTLQTPEFLHFQRTWLAIYLLAMFSDWLQGAYVYALYSSYGFNPTQIATLFVAGFASSMILGTFIGGLSDKYGRKRMCLVFSVLYTLSVLTKTTSNFYIQLLGRVFSGIATSLLFSAFEAWMVCEHTKRKFDPSLQSDTFGKATAGNGMIAVIAGLLSSFLADNYGYTAPFLFAILPLVSLAIMILFNWEENYGDAGIPAMQLFKNGFSFLSSNPHILLLGLAQSCFEGAMYAFVFMWSPALTLLRPADAPALAYGVIFATFMVSVMCGSYIFGLNSKHITKLPYFIHAMAGVSMLLVSLVTDELSMSIAFLIFEAMCGMFWPTYGTLRSIYVPEASRAAISNVFRIPLNAFVLGLLLNSDKFAPTTMFMICGGAHMLSFALYAAFSVITEKKKLQKAD